jgi:hypothetical protein
MPLFPTVGTGRGLFLYSLQDCPSAILEYYHLLTRGTQIPKNSLAMQEKVETGLDLRMFPLTSVDHTFIIH